MLARAPVSARAASASSTRLVHTRAAVADLPRPIIQLEDAPACPCVAAVFAAKKDKCIHPTRPVKDACPDCPRRKGKGVVAESQSDMALRSTLEVFAAKDKCVHPGRPVKDACPDCPRRKGKGMVAVQEETMALSREFLEVFAAKDKCVHPTRPLKDACPDCPRRKGKKAFTAATQEDAVRPCAAVEPSICACPWCRCVEVFAAKDKCVHPGRPVKDACPDCPRRKGKGVVAVQEEAVVEVSAVAKGPVKCVHPHKPESASCRDCPRRKTKWGVAVAVAVAQAPKLDMRAMAAKTKCVHPTRPVKDACPDCPRRRK